MIGYRGGGASVSRGPAPRPKAGGGTNTWRACPAGRAAGTGRRWDRSLGDGRASGLGSLRLGLGERASLQCARPNGALGLPQNRLALPWSLRSSSTFSPPWI